MKNIRSAWAIVYSWFWMGPVSVLFLCCLGIIFDPKLLPAHLLINMLFGNILTSMFGAAIIPFKKIMVTAENMSRENLQHKIWKERYFLILPAFLAGATLLCLTVAKEFDNTWGKKIFYLFMFIALCATIRILWLMSRKVRMHITF